jgi:hypothetical protein
MNQKRIAIYGGIDLDDAQQAFVRYLAQAILKRPEEIVVLTGGYRSNKTRPRAVSTDSQVVQGIEELLIDPSQVKQRLLIMQPDPARDRADANRYGRKDTKAKIETLKGRTARQRRLQLVGAARAIVTVKGYMNTAMVLDAALAAGTPFLPLPFTGGDSWEYWHDYKDQICKWFKITRKVAVQMEKLSLRDSTEKEKHRWAAEIAFSLTTAIEKKCLVLLPYKPRYQRLYQGTVEPAIRKAGYTACRLDRDVYAGRVRDEFYRRLRESDCVIADATDYWPNVMYEIGYAHALGIKPFLIVATQAKHKRGQGLPLYLGDNVVYPYEDSVQGRSSLRETIEEWLLKRSDSVRREKQSRDSLGAHD